MTASSGKKRVQTRLSLLHSSLTLRKSVTGKSQFYLKGTHDRSIMYLTNAKRELAVITVPHDKTRLEIWSAELVYAEGTSTFFFVIENPRTPHETIGTTVRYAPALGDQELADRFRQLDPVKQLRQLGH
jgi:hypothetical protein